MAETPAAETSAGTSGGANSAGANSALPAESRRQIGLRAEEFVCGHLAAQGLEILARNWRVRRGELDIVARDGECLVFVEVRSRRSRLLGTPEESVTPRKQAQLIATAEAYIFAEGWTGPWRIDVAAVLYGGDGRQPSLRYYPDAVSRA